MVLHLLLYIGGYSTLICSLEVIFMDIASILKKETTYQKKKIKLNKCMLLYTEKTIKDATAIYATYSFVLT